MKKPTLAELNADLNALDWDHPLRSFYATCAIPKTYRTPKTPKRLRKTAKPKAERDRIAEVRQYVIGRERGRCRCCRFRTGNSMHELRPRSLGGKVSKRNSVWVCGDGVQGCHGYLQRHDIVYTTNGEREAEGPLYFHPNTKAAEDWLRIKQGEHIESAPMSAYEE